MLLNIQLLFLFLSQTRSTDHQIIVKLDPAEIIKTFASETSLKYLQKLADVFAKKAAENFVKEIKSKNYELLNNHDSLINKKQYANQEKVQKAILDEDKALALLEKPSPDGDNLEFDQLDLTKEDETAKKSIPVYSLMKVNGKYVRRLLGLI